MLTSSLRFTRRVHSVVFSRFISSDNHVKLKLQSTANICESNQIKTFDSIPGPKPVPVLGYLWHVLPGVGKYYGIDLPQVHILYEKEYGKIVRLRNLKFSRDMVLCYDSKDIETIFRNEGPWPMRDTLPSIKYYRELLRPDLFQGYGGVFTSDGEEWQEARSIMNKMLMQPRVVKHYIKPFTEVADDFINRIRYLANKNDKNEMPEDFNKEIMKWALESVGVLSLDTKFGLLANDNIDEEKLKYLASANEFFELIYKIDFLPSLARYFSTPLWKRYIKVMDNITDFTQKQINLTKTRLEKEGKLNKDINDMSVIEKLMKNYDNKFVFGNVLDILLGGVDTTSRTMSSTLYLLAKNMDKQEILRREINEVFSKDETITIGKLEQMPYLRAIIKESMRLSPITFGLSRRISKDLVLSGYHVPKQTDVVIEQIPLLWSEEYFPEPNKFKPERWLRKDNKVKEINPWVMFTFGFGPRSCVGRRVAQSELEILLIKIIKNFKLEWHHDEPKYAFKLLYGISSPLQIRMIPINN